jgi:hypothetical protein
MHPADWEGGAVEYGGSPVNWAAAADYTTPRVPPSRVHESSRCLIETVDVSVPIIDHIDFAAAVLIKGGDVERRLQQVFRRPAALGRAHQAPDPGEPALS